MNETGSLGALAQELKKRAGAKRQTANLVLILVVALLVLAAAGYVFMPRFVGLENETKSEAARTQLNEFYAKRESDLRSRINELSDGASPISVDRLSADYEIVRVNFEEWLGTADTDIAGILSRKPRDNPTLLTDAREAYMETASLKNFAGEPWQLFPAKRADFLERLKAAIAELDSIDASVLGYGDVKDVRDAIVGISENARPELSHWLGKLDSIGNDIRRSSDDLEKAQGEISALDSKKRDDEDRLLARYADDPTHDLIEATINRFGPVFIGIFIAAIMLAVYRYSVRLASFYEGRSDAIRLAMSRGENQPPLSPTQLQTLMRAFTPESVNFGKAPETPIQQLVDLAKEVGKQQKPTA